MHMSPDDPWFADVVRIEADALARRHGVEHERVVRVFERLADAGWLAPNFPWNTALDEAAAVVGIDRALTIFEREDILTLARHVSVVDFLTEDELAPAFTHTELAEHLQVALAHLESNRESSLRVGYPATRMSGPGWLRLRLECVLPVKEPWQDLDSDPTYRWEAEPPDPPVEISVAGGHLYFPVGRLFTDASPSFVDFEDAPILRCLTPAEAERAAGLRSRVLEARRDVLAVSLKALGRARPDESWPGTLSSLTQHLTASDVDFLLWLEATMKAWDPGAEIEYRHGFRAFVTHRGGLSDLFELAGQCELALSLNRYHDILSATADLLGDDPISSYYEVIGRPCRRTFDAALDRFTALEVKEEAFWVRFKKRVNRAIAEDFSEPVTITVRVKRPYVEHFEPTVRSFAEWQKEHLEHGGAPLNIVGGAPSPAAPRSDNGTFPPAIHLSCDRDGERHEVLVGGLPVLLTDQHLALLLRLIRARLEDHDGWVDIERPGGDGLIDAGLLSDSDRALNRFRTEFKTACRPHNPTQLFPRSQGKIRLATPGDSVTWNETSLLRIENAVVVNEAKAIISIRRLRTQGAMVQPTP